MKYGTNYFITYTSARNYYATLGFNRGDVDNKINEREIFIGRPKLKSNESLMVDEDGRFWIDDAKK
jgi:hypothetical protein